MGTERSAPSGFPPVHHQSLEDGIDGEAPGAGFTAIADERPYVTRMRPHVASARRSELETAGLTTGSWVQRLMGSPPFRVGSRQ
jgi:hypothetical protein